MSIILEIPDTISRAMRLPKKAQKRQLKTELALSLYAQGILGFGKACELAEISQSAFGALLGQRGIPRQYDEQDIQDDIAYARGQ
jgi:predicted HTH domain antitoxin